MSKTVLFQTIQFSICTLFKCEYSLIVKNISISSYSDKSSNKIINEKCLILYCCDKKQQ